MYEKNPLNLKLRCASDVIDYVRDQAASGRPISPEEIQRAQEHNQFSWSSASLTRLSTTAQSSWRSMVMSDNGRHAMGFKVLARGSALKVDFVRSLENKGGECDYDIFALSGDER